VSTCCGSRKTRSTACPALAVRAAGQAAARGTCCPTPRCSPAALDCWRRITSHRRAEAIVHRQLGRALSNLGRAGEADEHLHTALAIFTELGENYHQARTLYIIAMTRLAGGQPEQAIEAISRLERARPLMEAEDHPLSLSELLTALAVAYERTGDEEQARACVDHAAELQQQLNLPDSHPARAQTIVTASQLR
jgi:Flp pilus assembly protein TadD